MGHILMENRNGLAVDTRLTRATGIAERDAALSMVKDIPGRWRITLGADKGYDAKEFVKELRRLKITPLLMDGQPGMEVIQRVNVSANKWKRYSAG